MKHRCVTHLYGIPLLNFTGVLLLLVRRGRRTSNGRKFTIYQSIILYRKFSADKIFDGYCFRQQQVLITNDAGTILDIVDESEAGENIEKHSGILCPGFINAHCHLELSHMKGHIPKHTGLVDFVLKILTERHYAEQDILLAITNAEEEMLQNGIVAVGDICNNTLTISQKSKGRLHYHNFVETSGFVPAFANDRFNRSLDILKVYQATLPTQRSTINPHAPYSVSPQLFALINELPGNDLLTMHNQETAAENEFFEKGTGDFLRLYQQLGIDISYYQATGKSSLQSCLPHFTKGQSIILVHNLVTSPEDIKTVQHTASGIRFFFCLCANANLYISNTLPDVPMLMEHADQVVLGTDSLASNDQLSILAEIKTLQQYFPSIGLDTMLKWATSTGSRALQMDGRLGSFEKGRQPGILLIENTGERDSVQMAKVNRLI